MVTAMTGISLASAEIFMLTMICVILLVDLFAGARSQFLSYILSQFTLIISAIITLSLSEVPELILFNGHYIHDGVATLLKLFIYMVSFFVLMYSRDYVNANKLPVGDYNVLCLLSILGMLVLVSAYSMITLYLGIELLSLPLYALIALKRDSFACQEAAMKYFVLGALSSGMLLYGFSMIYGATESLVIGDIYRIINTLPAAETLILGFGLVFILVGIAFKLGGAPFHMWVPDVYAGASNSVTLLIATVPKIAAFGLLVRLLIDGMPLLHPDWQQLLIVISILSMGIGNFVAIVQTNIKRMLAYSSIAHIGYLLLGLIAATPDGYGAAMFYMLTYVLMSLGAFGMLVLLSKSGYEIENIEDFKGLNHRNPWLALMMLLIMFSMAGVPPLVGFMSKLAVLEALVDVNLTWLAVVALILSLIGAYYYLRVVKVIYFDSAEDLSPIKIPSLDTYLAISLNGIIILLLGLVPGGLFLLCRAVF